MRKESTPLRAGKIVRSEDPLNLEMPFENLDGFITPTKLFYVRTHFPIPKIDQNKWRLRIEGEVERPFEINYGELIKLESAKIPVTLELPPRWQEITRNGAPLIFVLPPFT